MNISQFVDCLMHLLFLEIVKASRYLIKVFIYKKKKLKIYNYVKDIVYDTVPLKTLDWCKLIEAEAGWVSDNHLAYYRLIKWIHHSTTMYNKKGINNDVHNNSVTEINMMIRNVSSMVAVFLHMINQT